MKQLKFELENSWSVFYDEVTNLDLRFRSYDENEDRVQLFYLLKEFEENIQASVYACGHQEGYKEEVRLLSNRLDSLAENINREFANAFSDYYGETTETVRNIYQPLKRRTLEFIKNAKDILTVLTQEEPKTTTDTDGQTNSERRVEPIRLNMPINQLATYFYELHQAGMLDSSKTNIILMIQTAFRDKHGNKIKNNTLNSIFNNSKSQARSKKTKPL